VLAPQQRGTGSSLAVNTFRVFVRIGGHSYAAHEGSQQKAAYRS